MTDTRSALIIDDERDIRELLVMTLGRMGLRCDTAATLADARAQLAAHARGHWTIENRLHLSKYAISQLILINQEPTVIA